MTTDTNDFDRVYPIYERMVRGFVDTSVLPQTVNGQIELIEMGVMIYNSKREGNEIECDTNLETLKTKNGDLTDEEVLLLCNCMLLQTYRDLLIEMTSMISMSTKDSAIKDYKGQVSSRRQMVKDQEFLINTMVLGMLDEVENGVV